MTAAVLNPTRPAGPSGAAAEAWALVERAQTGDRDAFADVYRQYADLVFRIVYSKVRHRQLAEDLTSDVFVRALRGIGNITWQGRDLGAWLGTIARNRVADHYKSARYRVEVTCADVLDDDHDARSDHSPEGNPEATAVAHLGNLDLMAALVCLTAEQHEVIVLRYLRGLNIAETAQAMGREEGAVKALHYRAVRALARLVDRDSALTVRARVLLGGEAAA